MTQPFPRKAKQRVQSLITSLEALVASDPEQVVDGIAVPVRAAALEDVKRAVPGDPVVTALIDLMSADFIGGGESIRAASMLVVAHQLDAAIGRPRPAKPMVASVPWGPY